MPKHGKRYRALIEGLDLQTQYSIDEALEQIKKTASAKFDESVDVALRLGIDPRKSDQQVRGTIALPHGTGRSPRVAVITQGENADTATLAGADVVGGEDLIAKIEGDWSEFDVLVATPDMMRLVSRLGKKLGPRMPNAKAGTVTTDVGQTVTELKQGRFEYRNDRSGVIHVSIGRASFEPTQLRENLLTLLAAIVRAKPATARGTYLKSITVANTMGPGIRVDPAHAAGEASAA